MSRGVYTDVSSLCFQNEGDKVFVEVCKRLMANLQDGQCNLTFHEEKNGKVQFESVVIDGTGKALFPFQKSQFEFARKVQTNTLKFILQGKPPWQVSIMKSSPRWVGTYHTGVTLST